MLNGKTILFQGDSVTDAGRDRDDIYDLGNGYPLFVKNKYEVISQNNSTVFINKGISGNRTGDLIQRWESDCLSLKPDIVSILIGINDCWRRYDRNDPTPVEVYEENYRKILRATKEAGIDIIICEPFVLPVPQDREEWRVDLDPKIHSARKLAKEFNAVYVPLDGLLAASKSPHEELAKDGVHPTAKGHELIADWWLRFVLEV